MLDPDDLAALGTRLRESGDLIQWLEQPFGPLPGNPWARRLVVALADQTSRQRWVGRVVKEHLQADPSAIATGGHPGIPAGRVPGASGWRFYFHGIGCCLTHDDGTVLDVDFDEHGADSIDPYFYNRFLESAPKVSGVEATLRRPAPLDEWWMSELDGMRALGWLDGDHRVQLTSLGHRWAASLRPAVDVMAGDRDPLERACAAVLIEDFPYAVQIQGACVPSEVRSRADESVARRASELHGELSRSRSRDALAGLAVHDPGRAARVAEELLRRGPLDGLTSLALQILLAGQEPPPIAVLIGLARRASGTEPPAPHLRTEAVLGVLRRFRADSLPDELRAQLLDVLSAESRASEGVAALLGTLLDYESGLRRLSRSLQHEVPLARAEAAAALALLGTPEAAEALRIHSDAAEAKAALALLRGFTPAPGPGPVGHVIEVRGRPRRVYPMNEIVAAECPAFVRMSLEQLARKLGPLLERWWAQ